MNGEDVRGGEVFEDHRRYLTGLAYRMLGTLSDAEDVVQEAYLRWHSADHAAVREPRAFLTRIVARLCLDLMKSARVKREQYIGPWLPEPILDDEMTSAVAAIERAEDLSIAFLLALERLSPLERAAFLLHDVFGVEFAQIAESLERSEESCRQLANRARGHVRGSRPRFPVSTEEGTRLAGAFLAATRTGDLAELMRLLAEDVVLISDGGGKRLAALRPILGSDRVARFFAGLAAKSRGFEGLTPSPARINGLPGYVIHEPGGMLQTIAFEAEEGRITGIYILVNPEKLRRLANQDRDRAGEGR